MADYDLGVAKGKIVIDASGVDNGIREANRGIDELDTKAKNSKGSLVALETALIGVGIAGAAAFGYAIKVAADFEASLSGIKAVSGATETQMESLRKKALKLGADTVFSAGEAALAMEELSKAGLTVEEILDGAADATVNLAAAGEISLPEAATIAANAMNQFGLSASELPHVADLIAGAANASSIDVSDFGMAMAQAGATANLSGLSFDDLALAITAMGNAGIKGSDAGTSIKTFLSNLIPVTDKQIDLFHELGLAVDENATSMNTMGIAFFDAQGQIKPMEEIAGVLGTALQGMSEQQKLATLETLFGSDAIRAAAIIAETGAAGFDELATSMGNISAQDVAETRMDNLKGSIEQLKGSLETAAIIVGERFLPALRNMVDFGTEVVNKFSEMDEKQQNWILGLAGGTAGLAGLVGGMGLFIHQAAPVVSGIGSLMSGLGPMLTNPFVLAAIAIAALVAGFIYAYKNSERFREIVDAVVEAVKNFAVSVWKYINEVIIPALKDFVDFIVNDVWPVVKKYIDMIVGFFTDVLAPAIADVWNIIKDAILEFWGWFDTNVISTASAFIDLLIAIFDKVRWFVVEVLVPIFQVYWAVLSVIIETAWTIIKMIIDTALGIIMTVINTFISIVQTAWGLFGDNIMAAIRIAFGIIKSIVETVLGIIRGIFQVLTGIISGDWGKFTEGLSTLWNTMWEYVKTVLTLAWDFIKLIIETAIDAVHLIISGAIDLIKLTWSVAWDSIKLVVLGAWEAIKGFVKAGIDGAYAIVKEVIGFIKGFWSDTWGAIESKVFWIWEAIKGVVKAAIDLVKTKVDEVMNVVKGIWNTIWDGISGKVQTAWDIIKGIVDKIVNGVQGAIDKVKGLGTAIKDFGPGIPIIDLARGGIFHHPIVARIAEAGGSEAVIPMDNSQRAMDLMLASGLGQMFMENYAGVSPMGPGAIAPSAPAKMADGSVGSVTGVQIDTANFYDSVDVATLLSQAEFATQGLR